MREDPITIFKFCKLSQYNTNKILIFIPMIMREDPITNARVPECLTSQK